MSTGSIRLDVGSSSGSAHMFTSTKASVKLLAEPRCQTVASPDRAVPDARGFDGSASGPPPTLAIM